MAGLDKEKTRMTPQQYLEFLKGEIQFLSRMWEKFNRIENILLSGKTHCKDESVKDTLRDLSNYCHLLSGFLEDKK